MTVVAALALAAPVVADTATPAIPFRGVVEGYYGRPWGTEGRLSLLKFMGEQKMNVFIYGPKDDPYHHAKWREAYPAKEMADFRKLLVCAKENGINFTWAIHLGGTFKKGSADDYAALFRKLGWMYDAGFRSFAAFFDDFGAADAPFHAEICNRIVTDFLAKKGDCAPLMMCPSVYWGAGHPYQKKLGELLDPSVNILWTGRGICTDITADTVKQITADFRRPPYIWWNWPVNDYCRTKILLGRTYGLEPCAVAGFVTNPMENCEANKIALYGIAKWCHDPANFDSQKTWEESFSKIYPDPEVAAAMRIFAEHNSDQGRNVHNYRREESVSAAPLCAKAREEYTKTGKLTDATRQALTQLFGQVGGASAALLKKLPADKGLGWEMKGWLEAEVAQMQTGLRTLRLLTAKDKATVSRILSQIRMARQKAVESAAAHRVRFAAATFPEDAKRVKSPEVSTRELQPTIELILEGELRKLYTEKTGKASEAVSGMSAFSHTKSMPTLVVGHEDKFIFITPLLEPREVKPGESFGLAVPDSCETTYFHARVGNADAAQKGVIEVSKDGKVWKTLDVKRDGGQMQTRLNPKDGWRQARYRNASTAPVSVKLNLFKFDIAQPVSLIDNLLEALSPRAK